MKADKVDVVVRSIDKKTLQLPMGDGMSTRLNLRERLSGMFEPEMECGVLASSESAT